MSASFTYSLCTNPGCGGLNKVSLTNAETKQPVCGRCKGNLPLHDGINDISPESLRILQQKSPLPVVTDFWAPWCGPCRMFAPVFSAGAKTFAGRAVFVKVNTETHPSASALFGIRGIPALLVSIQGREVARQSGAMHLPMFSNWLTQTLSGASAPQ